MIGRGLSLETVSGSLTNKDAHSQDLVLVDLARWPSNFGSAT